MAIPARKEQVQQTEKHYGLIVELASTLQDVYESQKLRRLVFEEETGASFPANQSVDRDHYDPHCLHLLVREYYSGHIVGSTRILTDTRAKVAGGFYSQSEFNIESVLRLPGRIMEIGRTCIHPEFRSGSAIAILWAGLARLIEAHEINYLMGCASISLHDGYHNAQAAIQYLREKHPSPPAIEVSPIHPFHLDENVAADKSQLPPLLKAYLRLGAYVWGEPSLDEEFNTADVFILLDTANLNPRYHNHFIARTANATIEVDHVGSLSA